MKHPIELRRIRDFGQIINDSFTFFKENLKPLLKVLFIICGFFIVVGIVTTTFQFMNTTAVFKFNPNSYDTQTRSYTYLLSVFINLFVVMFTQAFIYLTTLCYISVYLQKNNTTPTIAEVWGYFRFYFLRVLGSGILIFFLLVIGSMFCIVPGIWLFPILYLIIPIIVIENSSFSYAFNKSFRIIKANWWLVFGVLFIMSLIVGVLNLCVGIPEALLTTGGKFFSTKTYSLPITIVLSVIKNILTLAYALPAIGLCLCYFSLTEQKDGTGLLDRIEKLGKSDDAGPALPAEEY
jgi:hypothetical protein